MLGREFKGLPDESQNIGQVFLHELLHNLHSNAIFVAVALRGENQLIASLSFRSRSGVYLSRR